MKKYFISFVYTLFIILIGTIITTLLYYFNITSDKFNTILLYLIGVISLFVGSLKLGYKENKKGVITGLIYFVIWFIILLFTSFIIFKSKFQLNNLVYYLILLIFTIIGAIIGKNKKEEANIN